MIFHSQISENKIQVYFVVAVWQVIYDSMPCVHEAVLLCYFVFGRKSTQFEIVDRLNESLSTLSSRPAQVASRYG